MKRKREGAAGSDDSADDASGSDGSGYLAGSQLVELGAFKRGNIVQLSMKNFLTFVDSTLHPGPDLNLVIGPNGSGKSSVVGAVLIGLNGSLKLLGRSNKLESFIRHGKNKASVEVSIHDAEHRRGVRTVKRIFDRAPSSQWFIDGKKASAGDVDKLRVAYNIQLENLCMFLPQDRVSEFAQQTPHGLLINTITSIGGSDMATTLEDLKDQYRLLEEHERKGKSDAETLESLRRKNKDLESDVQLFHERQAILEKIKTYEQYKPWLKYSLARDRAVETKAELDAAKGELKEHDEELKQAMAPTKQLETVVKDHEAKFMLLEQTVKKNSSELRVLARKIEGAETDYHDAEGDIKLENKKAETRANKKAQAEDNLRNLVEEKSVVEPVESLNDQIHELIGQRQTITDRIREISQQKHDLQNQITEADRRQKRLRSVLESQANAKQKLLQKLTEFRRDGNNAPIKSYEFVQANRDRFRGSVFGPVATELKVGNEFHAKVLETSVPPWAMAALVVETQEDRDLLLRELKERQGLRVDILSIPKRSDISFNNPKPIDELRGFGLDSYADTVFEAPVSVKRAILAQFPLHSMLLGNQQAAMKLDEISEQGVKLFFTPESSYSVKRSKYGNRNRSTLINPLKPARFFAESQEDRGEIDRLRKDIDEAVHQREAAVAKMKELSAESAMCASEGGSVGESIEGLKRKRRAVQKLDDSIKACKDSIAQYEDEERNYNSRTVESQSRKLNEMRSSFKDEIQKFLTKHEEQLSKLKEFDSRLALYNTALQEKKIKTRGLRSLEASVDQLRNVMQDLSTAYRDSVKEMRACKTRAEREANIDAEARQTFATLPQDLEELQDLIENETARAEAFFANDMVIRDYEKRRTQIAELERRIGNDQAVSERKKVDLDQRKDEFIVKVKSFVDDISVKFAELYKLIDCSGMVMLKDEGGVRDLEVDIRVSYRDKDDLTSLKASVQSGGEQMMATMIYIFALQRLTPNAAFRIVDEMNQGVDQRNERALMGMMIDHATTGESQQTFIITPKLLEGLPLGPKVIPHVLLNGDVQGEDVYWNPNGFVPTPVR
ncbi:hypothetical protein NDN08_006531 [Rhodosorus marinus]|uniref:Structural maintenance of chromosomes protein 5 n=1 Tax=Rhodosorus marinus TaxID=101924 RepID=A0AAV8ULZ3_9RHOD|nr:hypothetical protein NDN08_006531 [Rhodosorus marinus]